MSHKNETAALIYSLLITVGLIASGLWWIVYHGRLSVPTASLQQLEPASPITDRLSIGDKILITADLNPDKRQGVDAVAAKDFNRAIQHFQAALQTNKNDPETLIYLNNAKASLTGKPIEIAVVVPISSNLNIAKEMLRGVAQAQLDNIIVEIADDSNSPDIAKQISTTLVNDSAILGVIGHNSSDAALAAAPIYQRAKLVMIAPTGFSNALSGLGDFIFRTVPNIRTMATPLATYAVTTAQKRHLALCADANSPDSLSFKDEFVAALSTVGGKIVPISCDFSAPNFDPERAITEAISGGADGLMLAPHIDRINQAVAVAAANRNQLTLFGSTTLYTMQTLATGSSNVNGLVISVPWHPQLAANQAFVQQARQLWGGNVSWRTATSYDATAAMIAGLEQGKTRSGLQQALHDASFYVSGAGDAVQFLPNGDRAGQPALVQVETVGPNQYDFRRLQP
jgi:branched-chain amino acid transport system substrate-binding protein